MKYYVTYKIEARYVAKVEADSLEEAMDKAKAKYIDADFGEAENISGYDVDVKDEKGNCLWEY